MAVVAWSRLHRETMAGKDLLLDYLQIWLPTKVGCDFEGDICKSASPLQRYVKNSHLCGEGEGGGIGCRAGSAVHWHPHGAQEAAGSPARPGEEGDGLHCKGVDADFPAQRYPVPAAETGVHLICVSCPLGLDL